MSIEEAKELCKYIEGFNKINWIKLINEFNNMDIRINKTIEYIEKFISIDNNTIVMTERQREHIISILKGEGEKE